MNRQGGFSLIELLVAVGLGALITVGLVSLQGQARALSGEVTSAAELHDTARLALAYLDTDLRQAGFFGYVGDPTAIDGSADATDPVVIPVAGDCGPNFALTLNRPLEGRNNRFGLDCSPYGGASRGGSDVLIIRRAASIGNERDEGRIQLAGNPERGQLLGPGVAADLEDPVDLRDLAVSIYYVSADSSAEPGQASLRRKVLSAGPRMTDEEIAPRVEDLQIQFGIDLQPPGTPGSGSADMFVNPDDSRLDLPDARIVAARVWLLTSSGNAARHPTPPVAPYADRAVPPSSPGKQLLISRTYRINNGATVL